MGSLIGACLGSFVASLCCGACGQCRPPKENRFGKISRLPYLFLIILSGIFAVIMSEYGETELDLEFYSRKLCQTSCSGNGSVYRVSFVLFLFELLHLLIVPFVNDFHWMCFGLKFIIYVICLILVFALDDGDNDSNEFFNDYSDHFARYISIFYLLIQIIIIIDWAWLVNEFTQSKLNEFAMSNESSHNNDSKNPWIILRAIVTIGLYVIVIVFIALFYDWFGGDDCHLHNTLISITLIIVVINGIGAAIAGGGALPVAALISTYAMFLLFSALKASDDEECNRSHSGTDLAMWIGIIFALIMLCVASMRADLMEGAFDISGADICCLPCLSSRSDSDDNDTDNAGLAVTDNRQKSTSKNIVAVNDSDNESDAENVVELGIIDDADENTIKPKEAGSSNRNKKENTKLVEKTVDLGDPNDAGVAGSSKSESSIETEEQAQKKKKKEKSDEELEQEKQIKNSVFFHLILCLTSCYMAMLFTDWGTSSDISTLGDVSAWVNIGVQWVSMLLFWQSLYVYYKEVRSLTQEQ